jgi:hypothetical protein
VKRHLPLSNIVWKSPIASQRDGRVITELDMEFTKFSLDVFPKNVPSSSWARAPYLHLFLVGCDDVELYRSTVRKKIQDWLAIIQSKRHEWLILYLTQEKSPSGNFLKSTVFDKLRSEFDAKKVVVLQQTGPGQFRDPENWRVLFSKMVEGIITSFNASIVQYDDQCRKMEAQRTIPGWNYNQFFTLKEGLAQAYENVGLPDEALMQYEELEISYYQTLAEQEVLPWFKSFGGTDPGDDSADILNISRKEYRENIAKSTISIFDFRVYLNARQCLLMLRQKKPVDVLIKSKNFITTFSRSLKAQETSLIPNFRTSWMYTSCLGVLLQTEELVAVSQFSPEVLVSYNAKKGELLHFARIQVDKIGLICRYLPRDLASLVPCEDADAYLQPSISRSSLTGISNEDLRLAASSIESFDKLYHSITKRAIQSFELALCTHAVAILKIDLGLLNCIRGKHFEAIEVLQPIAADLLKHSWTDLAVWIWIHLLESYKTLGELEPQIDLSMNVLKLANNVPEDIVKNWVAACQRLTQPLTRNSKDFLDLHVENVDGDDMCVLVNSKATRVRFLRMTDHVPSQSFTMKWM